MPPEIRGVLGPCYKNCKMMKIGWICCKKEIWDGCVTKDKVLSLIIRRADLFVLIALVK